MQKGRRMAAFSVYRYKKFLYSFRAFRTCPKSAGLVLAKTVSDTDSRNALGSLSPRWASRKLIASNLITSASVKVVSMLLIRPNALVTPSMTARFSSVASFPRRKMKSFCSSVAGVII